ncbi:AAA family ATPase [Alkalimonas amylolytica]|uniref:Predicted ATP-binding protein involved in virulence n=1 Tax=Alkalimonas amylolytica TaxID=152573 RepID=A0A1H3XR68_ALKAM|nr:AAA family ATPase [Alkalimonas amylolytica]SEA01997.1 Predicted ATP-binding protein involved in virulence [Alkalimonas amylolytica]
MQKTLERIEIDKLFGRFDYSIKLSDRENNISILTAPNGYGKSTILKIINSFALGDHYYFIRENFKSIRFYLSDGDMIEVIHLEDDRSNNQVTIRTKSNSTKVKDPFGDGDDRTFIIERNFPFLTRVGPRTWRHDRTGETFNPSDILSRYGDHPVFRRNQKRDEWLEKLRKSVKVFSIPTNRLKSEEDYDVRGHSAQRNSLMVGALAKEIQEKMQSAIRNQFEEGRKKETSFPTRLIESLKGGVSLSRESVFESIKAIQEYEERYGRLGLVPHTETTKQLNVHAESTESAGMLVLKTYLDDIREKFSSLEHLAQKLDVFCSSINRLIAFKTVSTSADEGIIVRVIDGDRDPLSLSVLSSGEQHLIVLIGKLVFNTNQGSLVLIDEPEISFHPEWQEKFLSILEEIQKVNDFTVLVATHSPILIGDRWESVIELAEQHQVNIIGE